MCIKCKHLYGTMFEGGSDGHDVSGFDCEKLMNDGEGVFPYLRRPKACKDYYEDAHRSKKDIEELRREALAQRRKNGR